jgi:hypothetical protein
LNIKQTNKSQRGRKREERSREKQTRNTTEIKEGKRNAKGSRTNDVTRRERSTGIQSWRKRLNKQKKSKNTKEENDKK